MEEKTNQELLLELNKLKRAQARIKRRTTFLLSIIAMLVLITSTLAWFTLSNFASINNIDLKISTAPELYIDIENRGTEDLTLWQKTLTNEMVNSYLTSVGARPFGDQLLDPVTTSDGIRFFSENGNSREANDNTYLEFKVWFLSTKEMYVHLSGQTVEITQPDGSVVTATTSCTTTDTGLKANVVRAMRVSFEDEGAAAIWEPNKETPVAGQTTFDVSGSFNDSTRVFHLNAMEPKQITIRLWIEGEDPECNNDVQAADVTIAMLFGGSDSGNSSFE